MPPILPGLRLIFLLILLFGTVTLSGCENGKDSNFSQFPGFASWRSAYPPQDAIPAFSEQQLLSRYRPRFFLPDGHEGPISFYQDYIAQGSLTRSDGSKVGNITQQILNAARHETHAVFDHKPTGEPPRMAVYARADLDKSPIPNENPWLFLTYTLVFRTSGLPAGLSAIAEQLLRLLPGSLDDWHQLDNYTSVYLALDENRRPVAVTLQQHNYTRTYLLGTKQGPGVLPLPEDGRIPIDVAIRSNELYPHLPGRIHRRAVSFLDSKSISYMLGDGASPFLSADDVTDPAYEIDPPLCFLPPSDAFYTFEGWLGTQRFLPGASGPPGADYNTLPWLKPLHIQTVISHWWEGDQLQLEKLDEAFLLERLTDDVSASFAPVIKRFAQMRRDISKEIDKTSSSAAETGNFPPPPGDCPDNG